MKTAIIATRMKVHAGREAEYQRRHDALWPEMNALLRGIGITEYRIFLDPETRHLFAILATTDEDALKALPEQKVIRDWWAYMADIMDTNEDQSPHAVPLKPVFDIAASDPPGRGDDDGEAGRS